MIWQKSLVFGNSGFEEGPIFVRSTLAAKPLIPHIIKWLDKNSSCVVQNIHLFYTDAELEKGAECVII